MKKILLIASIGCFNLYAPPKKLVRLTNNQSKTENSLSDEETTNNATTQPLVFIDSSQMHSSPNFSRGAENEKLKGIVSVFTRENSNANDEENQLMVPRSSPTKKNGNDDDEWDDTTDSHNTKNSNLQPTDSWLTFLFIQYDRLVNEQCAFQRFCQLVQAKKKYEILDNLQARGMLTDYIANLNEKKIGTGNSLLNEALAEARVDKKSNIVLQLLSAIKNYSNILTDENKESLEAFLIKDNTEKKALIAVEVQRHLERTKSITEICNAFKKEDYSGPNLLTIASAVTTSIDTLTEGVINNTLPEITVKQTSTSDNDTK